VLVAAGRLPRWGLFGTWAAVPCFIAIFVLPGLVVGRRLIVDWQPVALRCGRDLFWPKADKTV